MLLKDTSTAQTRNWTSDLINQLNWIILLVLCKKPTQAWGQHEDKPKSSSWRCRPLHVVQTSLQPVNFCFPTMTTFVPLTLTTCHHCDHDNNHPHSYVLKLTQSVIFPQTSPYRRIIRLIYVSAVTVMVFKDMKDEIVPTGLRGNCLCVCGEHWQTTCSSY